MKLVIPMAGRGSRFSESGVSIPKPLIEVHGHPMLYWALLGLKDMSFSTATFIVLQEHEERFHISDHIRKSYPHNFSVVELGQITEGQLATVMAARDELNDKEDILIANCDTYVESQLGRDILLKSPSCAGIISVADLPGDQWSFASVDDADWVVTVTEKVRISDHASTGLYYFSCGTELVEVADEILRLKLKERGEYYVIGAFRRYLEHGLRVKISRAESMWDMGTPQSLQAFDSYLQNRSKPHV